MSVGAVHQVLATLGYGDAIGHEVLGIQRVLRAAGYDSEIFVETADPRLEDLTYDYRDLVDASRPDNLLLHHFSIGSRASRVAFALPDRMALIYHNITPPQYFVGVHDKLVELCWKGRRELGAYIDRCDLALGDSEFNRAELEGLGFPRTGVLPVVPDFSHLDATPDFHVAGAFDDEWTNLLFVGRMIPNKRIENVIRIFHAYRTRINPRSRLLLVGSYGGFEKYLAMLQAMIGALGTPRRTLRRSRQQRGAGGLLRGGGPLPVRERARRLLRAARRGLPHARAGPRLCGLGGARDARWRRRALPGSRPRPRRAARRCRALGSRAAGTGARRAGRRAGSAGDEGLRRDAPVVRRPGGQGAAHRAAGGDVRLLGSAGGVRAARGAADVRPGIYKGLPK